MKSDFSGDVYGACRLVGISMFIRMINAQTDAGEIPAALKARPELMGQFFSRIVPGHAIYLLKCTETSGSGVYFKIGIAKDVGERTANIRTGCPLEISKVLYFMALDYAEALAVEQKILQQLDSYRVRGEWLYVPELFQQKKALAEFDRVADAMLVDNPTLFSYNPALKNDEHLDIKNYMETAWKLVVARVEAEGI